MTGVKTTLIIGAGFAGIGTAVRLIQEGMDEFVILERSDSIGGTWRDNSYPGAACDIPSLLYSYSFEQNPSWSQAYSGSAEILQYIERIVAKYDLTRFINFSSEVSSIEFDEESATWFADTRDGRRYAGRSIVIASGPLANVSLPDIRGIDSYEGKKMHSARWDHAYDLSGKRVAVVGTGASAVQIVPELVKCAKSVKVFQRTPGWVLPRANFTHPGWLRSMFRRSSSFEQAGRQIWFWGLFTDEGVEVVGASLPG